MFEWDETKRQANLRKHGVDFSAIARFDWSTSLQTLDGRKDYGEIRYMFYGLIDGRLHAAVVAPKESKIRIISLRKANAREVKKYEQISGR